MSACVRQGSGSLCFDDSESALKWKDGKDFENDRKETVCPLCVCRQYTEEHVVICKKIKTVPIPIFVLSI